jgi:hypothetical protein
MEPQLVAMGSCKPNQGANKAIKVNKATTTKPNMAARRRRRRRHAASQGPGRAAGAGALARALGDRAVLIGANGG